MSPEIRMDGRLVADVPDETGDYQMLDGSSLCVDVSLLDAHQERQLILLEGSAIGGKRVVGLTLEGKGNSRNTKKGGDKKEPILDITLHDRPIRISYRDQVWVERVRTLAGPNRGGYYQEVKRTYYNPRWMRR